LHWRQAALLRRSFLGGSAVLLSGIRFLCRATVLLRRAASLLRHVCFLCSTLLGRAFLTSILLCLPERSRNTQQQTTNRRHHCSLHRAVS
jgi:hypothetical protein